MNKSFTLLFPATFLLAFVAQLPFVVDVFTSQPLSADTLGDLYRLVFHCATIAVVFPSFLVLSARVIRSVRLNPNK